MVGKLALSLFGALIILLAGGAAAETVLAQGAADTRATVDAVSGITGGVTTATKTPETGSFDQLSHGGQKIARALFGAQTAGSGAGTAAPWSMDEIAAARQDGMGWGRIFKEMKAANLVQEKNLGQIISEHKIGPRRAEMMEPMEPGTDDTPTTPAETAGDGGFDQLSPGGQRIAKSLYQAQGQAQGTGGATGGAGDSWTLDRIAAARQEGEGWGKVFNEMKDADLIQEKNLGRLIAGARRNGHATGPAAVRARHRASSSVIIITTAGGRQIVVGRRKSRAARSRGWAARGWAARGDDGHSARGIGLTTAAGAAIHGRGNGKVRISTATSAGAMTAGRGASPSISRSGRSHGLSGSHSGKGGGTK